MVRTCWASRTVASTIARTCWAVCTMALWRGPVGQVSHRGRLGASPPPAVQTFNPRTVPNTLPKFTERGEKLKPGAQLTETLTQHGTTEVKLSPGVGSVVLEEHLEGSSPCRLKSRSAPNLPHRVQLLAAHAHSLVQRSHARTLRVPRHHSQRLSVPFRAPGPAEPCGVEVVGRRAKVPREPVVDSRGRRGSCIGSHVRRPACRLSSTSQPHLAPLPSSHLHQKPLSLVVSLSRVD